jgi:hypothetical protein
MAKLHTDREILHCIYDMYRCDFPRVDVEAGFVFIPIDVGAVASRLGIDKHLLFGRLYYDLRVRYLHRDPSAPNTTVSTLFEKVVGPQLHSVNFPYLTAVLAGLEEQRRRDLWTTGLAILALVVAVATAGVQWAGS